MVNFNLSLTNVNVQSLSILQTLGTNPNNPQQNTQEINDNFKGMVNNMLLASENQAVQADKIALSSELNANPELRSAVYQASAILNIMGQTADIAVKTPAEIEANPVINNILSSSGFTPAEKDIFVRSIKVTAIEISFRQITVSGSFDPETMQLDPAAVNILSTPVQTPSQVRQVPVQTFASVTAPAPQTVTLPRLSLADIQVTSDKIISAAMDLKTAVKDYIYNVLGVNDLNDMLAPKKYQSAEELTQKTEAAANTIVEAAHLSLLSSGTSVAPAQLAGADVQAKVELAKSAENLDSMLVAFTVFSAQMVNMTMTPNQPLDPAQSSFALNTAPAQSALEALGSDTTGFGRENFSKYEIVTSAATEVKDAVSKIVALINEMNGNMEIRSSYTFDMKLVEAQIAKFAGVVLETDANPLKNTVTIENTAVFNGKSVVVSDVNKIISQPGETQQAASMKFITSVSEYREAFTPYAAADDQTTNPAIPAFTKYMPATDLKAMIENKLTEDIQLVKQLIVPASDTVTPVLVPASVPAVFGQAADFAVNAKRDVVVKQVIEAVFAGAVTSKRSEIKLTLRPDNLGPVSVRLESRDGIVSAHMQVANSDVRDVLKANITELRDTLSRAGVNVSDVTISLANNNSGSGNFDARTPNKYLEWEGATVNIKETVENTAGYTDAGNGYLNLFA